jgi:hypothetical protein
MMRAGRLEAVDIFRKWEAERANVKCFFTFGSFAACLVGHFFFVADDRVRLLSDDTLSELDLPLNDSLGFLYAEPRGTPEETDFASGIVVQLPTISNTGDESERDLIRFVATKDLA